MSKAKAINKVSNKKIKLILCKIKILPSNTNSNTIIEKYKKNLLSTYIDTLLSHNNGCRNVFNNNTNIFKVKTCIEAPKEAGDTENLTVYRLFTEEIQEYIAYAEILLEIEDSRINDHISSMTDDTDMNLVLEKHVEWMTNIEGTIETVKDNKLKGETFPNQSDDNKNHRRRK